MTTTLMPRVPRPTRTPGAHGTALALGVLSLLPSRRSPTLLITIRCVLCAKQHIHTWGTGVAPGEATERFPHCANARPDSPQYLIAPAPTAANAEVLREYERRLREAEGRETAPERAAEPALATAT